MVKQCTLGTRGFSRVRWEFSVLAESRHILGGNRARKVSGTQGKHSGKYPLTEFFCKLEFVWN